MFNQKDQLPLLCESDEESHFTCPRKHRKYYRNSKTKIKGAALIFKNWPDHISSLAAYWWIGFIMIAITIFVIYNSLSIIDIVTSSRIPFAAAVSTADENFLSSDENPALNVYMHVFVQSYDEVNDEFYLKYVKRLAKKFTDYKFHIIVMRNDAPKSNDENNNDILARIVLRTNKLYRSEYWSDISIEYISVSKYLDNSPVKDSWRQLPSYAIPFLIRCVSIWDKGGLAFDPIMITPLFENSKYLEKLYNTFKKYKKSSNKIKPTEDEYKSHDKPKVNNIQDIIRILENDESKSANIPQYNLSEAENREESSFINIKVSKDDEHKQYKREVIYDFSKSTEKEFFKSKNYTSSSQQFEHLKNSQYNHEYGDSDDLLMEVSNVKYFPELTIDLKGNVIATSTPCHAFIGTVFSNIHHYNVNDTIEHIITDELSIFCKGNNISSCIYIEVIS